MGIRSKIAAWFATRKLLKLVETFLKAQKKLNALKVEVNDKRRMAGKFRGNLELLLESYKRMKGAAPVTLEVLEQLLVDFDEACPWAMRGVKL